jgi:hypothetical protein
MNDEIDLLKIKIDQAKANLSEDTLDAIAAVDWRGVIMKLRQDKGYTFEQLGDLETETELLLCGLVTPEEYPKELKKRMGISEAEVGEIVNTMNDLAFKKIQAELIKNIERKKLSLKKPDAIQQEKAKFASSGSPDASLEAFRENPENSEPPKTKVPQSVPEVKIPAPATPVPRPPVQPPVQTEEKEETHPMLIKKLTDSFKSQPAKTEHALDNITSTSQSPSGTYPKGSDPYREIPE